MNLTTFNYFEFFCYFISILPGFAVVFTMLFSIIKFRNSILLSFSFTYFALTAMCFMQFIDFFLHDILKNPYQPIPVIFYVDLISIAFIIFFITKTVLLLFYEEISKLSMRTLFFISTIPIIIVIYSFLSESFDQHFWYSIVSWILIITIGVNCVLFAYKYKNLRNDIQKKLLKAIWMIISFFLIIFINDRIFRGFSLNSLPIFYFILSNFLIYFFFIKFVSNKDKNFYSNKDSLLEKYKISKREKEIVELILLGKSNRDISETLFISERTVKNHIYNIYRKFDIKSRFEMIHLFIQ